MRRYYRMIIAVLAVAMLSACSAKSNAPATEKTGDDTGTAAQSETRQPVIRIQEETSAASETEASVSESTQAADPGSDLLKGGQTSAGAEAVAETKAAGETEPVKAYSVEAFEKTMYATASVNVRASYTTQSEILTSLSPGQRVKVTGRSANGWMRIIYGGKDAYVYQKYLSDRAPASTHGTEPKPSESQAAVVTYPGNVVEDPVTSPGELPIVEPIPIMTAPGQGTSSGTSGGAVTEYGPGVASPGGGSSWTEPGTPGYGPGMS